MKVILPWIFLTLAALAGATPPTGCVQKVKETISPPRGWTKQGPAPPEAVLELRIALPQPNFPELEKHLYEIRLAFLYPFHAIELTKCLCHQATRSMIAMDNIFPRRKWMN